MNINIVSPFEENKEGRTTTIYEDTNAERKESGNRNHQEKLQKSSHHQCWFE
jgi:hypothetical protein